MSRHAVEYETLMDTSFTDNIRSGLQPRWERKKEQQQQHDKTKGGLGGGGSTKEPQRPRMPLGAQTNSSTASAAASTSITSSVGSSSLSTIQGDRFIPNRGNMNLDLSQHLLRSTSCTTMATTTSANSSRDYADETNVSIDQLKAEIDSKAISDATKSKYTSNLSNCMFGVDDLQSSRILSYQDKAPAPKGDTVNNLNILYSASASAAAKKSNAKLVTRSLPSAPFRILDAPDISEDYYLNLLDWSTENILAVALGQTVYLWNAETGDITELCTIDTPANAYISSVSWIQQGGQHLAVGTSCGKTQLWDVEQVKQLRSMSGHADRVGVLAWNRHVLTSASRDTTIVNHDVRVAQHAVSTLQGHSQEVCGMKWSPDGETLASGGNDNLLCLWDASASVTGQQPRFRLTDHQAAVKALAWSPHERNLLATGGGTADRCIKFWNSHTGALLNSIDTGSQVCSLIWNPYEREILSSHGYSRNQLALWKYPSMAKIKEFEGHTSRVLHMAVSPDGGTVVSAAPDETLRFWNVFGVPTTRKTSAADVTFAQVKSKTSWTAQIR